MKALLVLCQDFRFVQKRTVIRRTREPRKYFFNGLLWAIQPFAATAISFHSYLCLTLLIHFCLRRPRKCFTPEFRGFLDYSTLYCFTRDLPNSAFHVSVSQLYQRFLAYLVFLDYFSVYTVLCSNSYWGIAEHCRAFFIRFCRYSSYVAQQSR